LSKLNERLFEKKLYKIATDIIGEERIIEEPSLASVRQKGFLPDFCGSRFQYKDKAKVIKSWKKFFIVKRDEAIKKLSKKNLKIWWRLKPEVDSWCDWDTKKIVYSCYGRFVIF